MPSAASRQAYEPASGELPGGKARRPRPLKIVAAQMPRDIDHLTDEIQARNALDRHRLRRKMPRIDATQRHFGLVIAKRSGGQHRPIVERRANLGEALLTQGADRIGGLLSAPILNAPLLR